jgi:predicted nucleic acid-binding protein
MTNNLVIFDTSVLIDHLRSNCHAARMAALSASIRHSSVVLAELVRGVKTRQEQEFFATFEKQHPILTPSEEDWLNSGRVLVS